jgi:hypothetical protein
MLLWMYANLLNRKAILRFRRAVMNDPKIRIEIICDVRGFSDDMIAMAGVAGEGVDVRAVARTVDEDFNGLQPRLALSSS